jgi:hypothetical protein
MARLLLLAAAPVLAGRATAACQDHKHHVMQLSGVVYDAFIIDPGDSLQVELLDMPVLSGTLSIGPDGTVVQPRLRAL